MLIFVVLLVVGAGVAGYIFHDKIQLQIALIKNKLAGL